MKFYPGNIPYEMRNNKNWVLFKKEDNPETNHPKKIMISVTGPKYHLAKSTEAKDWTTFDNAYYKLRRSNYDGMVYCLDKGIVFIDIDNSIDEYGNLSPIALEMLELFPNTYAERSCSGKGIHIFIKGKLPENSMKRNDSLGLEMYDTKRFACMTGDIISTTYKLKEYSEKIIEVAKKYLGEKEVLTPRFSTQEISMEDSEILSKAFNSKVGEKIERLYNGDFSDYPSQSNADLAFMTYLSFYTNNPNQLDSIMRSSGLYRDKWDEYRGDTTYGQMTINHALCSCKNMYKPKKTKQVEMY